ncbi:MAG TPA: hypothetical protein VEB64_13300, partial [Azospirillaceae bacterium]|nr:hypothetical protein [Azospirillaceae bacterium]
GSITTSAPALNDIGSIGHHMPSSGGRAKAVGPAFRIWMAERLRHKNRGIQGWDYSRLVLADFPTLWQVAVLMPGDDPALPQPGQVRLVVVVGPSSPDVSDPTVPCASDTLRTDVEEMLKPLISPFVTLSVENPFYVRVKVTAEVVFRDVATLADLTGRLNADLIGWLSPWPTPALGRRPTAYWMEVAIADFIRRRPYVVEILTLSLSCHFPDGRKGCHYFTSALEHDLSESSVESRRSAGTPATNRPATGEGAPA